MSRAAEKAKSDAELNKRFRECHETGAKEFGYAWLKMNGLFVNAAISCGVRPEEQPFKTLLSVCALKALVQMRASKAGQPQGETKP